MNTLIRHISDLPDLDIEIDLNGTPFPYQRKGIAYGLKKQHCINGDAPGLGKTLQAIATVQAANIFPCLVICPSSLKENWKREWEKWTNRKAIVFNESVTTNWHNYHQSGMADVFIVNPESLKRFFIHKINKDPKKKGFTVEEIVFKWQIELIRSVVIDEFHRLKDHRTQAAMFTFGICQGKEMVLGLTGTPVVNSPADLISQLAILGQLKKFGGANYFKKRFCSGPSGKSNLNELNQLLNMHCYFRREKKDVLEDLPDKMRQVVLCDLTASHRAEYLKAFTSLESYLKEYTQAEEADIKKSMRGAIMVQIGILKKISARGKIADIKEYVRDVLDSGEKLILFVHHSEVATSLKEAFPAAVSVLGTDDAIKRQSAVDNFQQNPHCKLIICSIKAAGVGLTLTASSRVAFVELPWTAADCEQCEDRAHRIGQKNAVQCTYFLGRNTIDQKIYKLIDSKRDMANAITGAVDDVKVSFIDDFLKLF